MDWLVSYRADRLALPLADRHYNRQKVGAPQFVPPGRCVVLITEARDAFWVTSWPEYVRHAWPGSWNCTAFRNEGPILSSLLIRQAVAATRFYFSGPPPAIGMITFVDPTQIRKKRDPGRCFLRAGFRRCGETQSGKLAFQLLPADMPEPEAPANAQLALLDG